MEVTKSNKAAQIIARLWKEAADKRVPIPNGSYTFNDRGYSKGIADGVIGITKQQIVGVEPKLLQSLDAGELKMVVKIIAELKMYNAFWYFDYLSAGQSAEKVIGRLRKKEVIYKTENLAMHIVNPWKIKRGAIELVLASTAKLLENGEGITERLYKNLDSPKKSAPNGFYSLQ